MVTRMICVRLARRFTLFAVAFFFAGYLVFVAPAVYAQVSPTPSIVISTPMDGSGQEQETAGDPVETRQTLGEVLRMENNLLTIRTDAGVQEFTISPGAVVRKNTFTAAVEDISPGDQVTLTTRVNGEVIAADVTGSAVSDTGKWLLPLLIAALVGVVIIMWIAGRAKQSHIKTASG